MYLGILTFSEHGTPRHPGTGTGTQRLIVLAQSISLHYNECDHSGVSWDEGVFRISFSTTE